MSVNPPKNAGFGNISAPTTTERRSPLDQALATNTDVINTLEKVLGVLEDRADPIMAPLEAPSAIAMPAVCTEEIHSEVVSTINVNTNRIDAAINRIGRVIGRLEV